MPSRLRRGSLAGLAAWSSVRVSPCMFPVSGSVLGAFGFSVPEAIGFSVSGGIGASARRRAAGAARALARLERGWHLGDWTGFGDPRLGRVLHSAGHEDPGVVRRLGPDSPAFGDGGQALLFFPAQFPVVMLQNRLRPFSVRLGLGYLLGTLAVQLPESLERVVLGVVEPLALDHRARAADQVDRAEEDRYPQVMVRRGGLRLAEGKRKATRSGLA